MADDNYQLEEQEMEAEALAAIFDQAFEIVSNKSPFVWSVKLLPVDCGGDEEEENTKNHVAIKLLATIPPLYPDEKPKLDIEIIKGLADPQRQEILKLAENEVEANAGMPAIYAVCEAVREWLAENNLKGQDDGSMYAQMMRRAKEVEKQKIQAEQKFETQKTKEEMTETELEELAVRKRRAEGTPCTEGHFLVWKDKFEEEMLRVEEELKAAQEASSSSSTAKKKDKSSRVVADRSGRLTGFEQFSGSTMVSMEAIEAAVDQIAGSSGIVDDDANIDVDEELFDDDEDLDDLDFDSDDSDEEEPDI